MTSTPRRKGFGLCWACWLGGEERGPAWSQKPVTRVQGILTSNRNSGNLGDGMEKTQNTPPSPAHTHISTLWKFPRKFP